MRAVRHGLVCFVGLTACVGGGEQGGAAAGMGDDGGVAAVGGASAAAAGHQAVGGTTGQSAGGSGGSGGAVSSSAAAGGSGGSGGSVGGAGGASADPSGGSVVPSSGADAGSGGSVAPTGITAGARDSHFPLVSGASWTYHHSGGTKGAWDETDTMTASTYQGKPAFLFEDQEDTQGARTHSTLVVQGTGVYRAYKEVSVSGTVVFKVSYDPAFLRYDEAWTSEQQKVTLDDSWVQTCIQSSVAKNCAPGAMKTGTTTHEYTVLHLSTSVTVPAGTFDTVEIQRVDPNTGETKLYWFAKGVGKVRDEAPATGAISELTSFTLP